MAAINQILDYKHSYLQFYVVQVPKAVSYYCPHFTGSPAHVSPALGQDPCSDCPGTRLVFPGSPVWVIPKI